MDNANLDVHYLGRVWHVPCWVDPMAQVIRSASYDPLQRGSISSLSTALMRSAHSRLAASPLIVDPWGERLVPWAARTAFGDIALMRLEAAAQCLLSREEALDRSLRSAAIYPNVILRTRFAEDALREAVQRGTRQYVILGAGFDTFALRMPSFGRELAIFELDHPTPQSVKRRRLRECGLSIPASLRWVAADLEQERLETVLARSGYRPDRLAFFSLLGVTMFLSRQANLATFAAIAACSAPGSELVFTYFDATGPLSESPSYREMSESGRMIGEPLLSNFDTGELAGTLRNLGFELIHDVAETHLVQHYDRAQGPDCMLPLPFSRFAHVRVAGIA